MLCLNFTSQQQLKLEQKVLSYKSQLLNDQKKRFDQIQIIDEIKFNILTEKNKSFDVIYPCIGENNSYLNSLRKKKDLKLSFILREEDRHSWQFSNKGYFNFKNNIPKILTNFKLQ